MNEQRLITAIASMCEVVHRQDVAARSAEERRVAVVRDVAERVRALTDGELTTLRARIDAQLLPVDPFHQRCNVFRFFDVEYDETRWTQWFASVMRPENGACCSRVAWRAFCDAVSHRASLIPPTGATNPADHRHWLDIVADESPYVEDEVPAGDLGRLDLLVTTTSIVVAIENKLWADWHDSPKGPQAERYREIATRRHAGDPTRRIGLVLLSQRSGIEPGDYPSDYVHVTWRDVGQALRRALRREWSTDVAALYEFWPIVLTLVSIEQDILGLSLIQPSNSTRGQTLRALSELATYLEGR